MARFSMTSAEDGRRFDTLEEVFLVIDDYPRLTGSATTLRFSSSSDEYLNFAGSGFGFDRRGGEIVSANSGIIQSFEIRSFGTVISASNLNVSMRTFMDAYNAESEQLYLLFLAGDDTFVGSAGDDSFSAGIGNDVLRGRAGDDDLRGDRGADTLIGGGGSDNLVGGQGADVFVFDQAPVNTSVDRIFGFSSGLDKIHLENDVFRSLGITGALGARYAEGASARDAGDRIIYQESSGSLWFDRDGTGSASKILIAVMSASNLNYDRNLSASDFFVI